MFSSDAKLFVKRRVQFHFSHAENVSSKLPKWTLFHLHLHLFNYSSTRYTSRRICFVSCLYISTYLKMFLVRFINRLAASHAVLPWFGCFFFPPVGALIRNVWLALKSAEVRSTLAKSLTADTTTWLSICCQKIGTLIAVNGSSKSLPYDLCRHLEKCCLEFLGEWFFVHKFWVCKEICPVWLQGPEARLDSCGVPL